MKLIKGTKEYEKAYEKWVREGTRNDWHFEYQSRPILRWMDEQTKIKK